MGPLMLCALVRAGKSRSSMVEKGTSTSQILNHPACMAGFLKSETCFWQEECCVGLSGLRCSRIGLPAQIFKLL